jgi:hypothetical protein
MFRNVSLWSVTWYWNGRLAKMVSTNWQLPGKGHTSSSLLHDSPRTDLQDLTALTCLTLFISTSLGVFTLNSQLQICIFFYTLNYNIYIYIFSWLHLFTSLILQQITLLRQSYANPFRFSEQLYPRPGDMWHHLTWSGWRWHQQSRVRSDGALGAAVTWQLPLAESGRFRRVCREVRMCWGRSFFLFLFCWGVSLSALISFWLCISYVNIEAGLMNSSL